MVEHLPNKCETLSRSPQWKDKIATTIAHLSQTYPLCYFINLYVHEVQILVKMLVFEYTFPNHLQNGGGGGGEKALKLLQSSLAHYQLYVIIHTYVLFKTLLLSLCTQNQER